MKRSDAERVPVIAMSANAFAEDIINSRISGMDEHLTKPLEPARLVNVLKDCIWRRNISCKQAVDQWRKDACNEQQLHP